MENNNRSEVLKLSPEEAKALRSKIQTCIAPVCKKYDFQGDLRIRISYSEIKIWFKSNNPFNTAKDFWDFFEEFRDSAAQNLEEYSYIDRKRHGEYLVLIFQRGERMQSKNVFALQNFIRETISTVYTTYDKNSTAKVYTNGRILSIEFNSENPYLGEDFWKLLEKVSEEIDPRLNAEGYEHQKPVFIGDHMVLHFEYKGK